MSTVYPGGRRLGSRLCIGFLCVVGVIVGVAPVNSAASDVMQVPSVDVSHFPNVNMLLTSSAFAVDRTLPARAFSVLDSGRPLPVSVRPLVGDELEVAVVLAGSLGDKGSLRAIKTAAIEFLLRLPQGTHMAVVAAGATIARMTNDLAAAVAAITEFEGGASVEISIALDTAASAFSRRSDVERAVLLVKAGAPPRNPSAPVAARLASARTAVLALSLGDVTGEQVSVHDLQAIGRLTRGLASAYHISVRVEERKTTDLLVKLNFEGTVSQTTVRVGPLAAQAAGKKRSHGGKSRRWLLTLGAVAILGVIGLAYRSRWRSSPNTDGDRPWKPTVPLSRRWRKRSRSPDSAPPIDRSARRR